MFHNFVLGRRTWDAKDFLRYLYNVLWVSECLSSYLSARPPVRSTMASIGIPPSMPS